MATLKRHLLVKMRAASQRVTWMLGTRFPETFRLVFVVGYPKSGTVWASQLVADSLGLPFPRYSYLPIGCPAVVHGHPTIWDSYRKAVYVLRDPRDVMVSAYFQVTRTIPEGDHPPRTRRQRRLVPNLVNKANIRENLPGFVATMMKRPGASPVNWPTHVQSYLDRAERNGLALLRYEELLNNGPAHLALAIERLTGEPPDMERINATIDRFSFARQAGRKPGQEDRTQFLRKGQAGDWRNHFTREAAEILDEHCGQTMMHLGYIESRDWVKECEPL